MGGGTATQHLNPSHTAARASDGGESYWSACQTNQIAYDVSFVLECASCFFLEIWSTCVGDDPHLSCDDEEMDSVLFGLN